jgi:hypothetical protein
MSMRLSEHASITFCSQLAGTENTNGPGLVDPGGTYINTPWVSMKNYARAMAYVELGAWNASDDIDHCRIEYNLSGSGAALGEITTDASGGDYDTDTPLDADGDFAIIEIRAEDLPEPNCYIRLYVGEDGNTGAEYVSAFLVRYGYAYPQKELQGAASSGSKKYVQP